MSMDASTSRNVSPPTASEAAFIAQALDYYRAVTKAGKEAPFGQFLNHAEKAVMEKGRELLRQSLESITQEAIHEVEKKKETRLCPKCQKKREHRGYREKNIDTAAGTIRPKRRYEKCLPCNLPEHPADALLGLFDYTVGFRSLAVRAGSIGSYETAKEIMKEFAGLEISHMTIRELCHKEAPKVAKWVEESPDVPKDFIEAQGNVEITIDAAKVNTTTGWRDIKVFIFLKRLLGDSALPSEWDTRKLPAALARVAYASIEEKAEFQKRLNKYRRLFRLGLTGDISALADGADWIWNIIYAVFGDIRECLDIYHALEHLCDTGKVLYKEGSAEYEQWKEETELELLESGFEKIEKRLDEVEKEIKEDELQKRESLRLLRGYLSNHRDRLCYGERLLEGRAIGSGQVEGACRHMIGRRLKQTGAKWLVERVNEMAVLCAVRYSDLWEKYWTQAI